MKSSSLSFGLLAIATLSSFAILPVPAATAQCVMADTNVQVAINGSRKKTDRTNDVIQTSSGVCIDNSISSTNIQVNTGGTERAIQRRQSRQEIRGEDRNSMEIDLPPVKIKTNVQIDVDNAADRLKY